MLINSNVINAGTKNRFSSMSLPFIHDLRLELMIGEKVLAMQVFLKRFPLHIIEFAVQNG